MKRRDSTTSQFKGVYWDKRREKWTAQCKRKYIGHFATEEAAALAGPSPRPPLTSTSAVLVSELFCV